MKINKDKRIIFRCTTEENDFFIDEAKKQNMSIGNYFINSAKNCESNKKQSTVNVREVAELGNFIKSLEYKYKIEDEDSYELNRRLIKLCQN